jgi:hypothetical protein
MERGAPPRPTVPVRYRASCDHEVDEQHDQNSEKIQQDLADLRYLWGGSYRITWRGQFRALDIATGHAVVASAAVELRMVLAGSQAAGTVWPSAGGSSVTKV